MCQYRKRPRSPCAFQNGAHRDTLDRATPVHDDRKRKQLCIKKGMEAPRQHVEYVTSLHRDEIVAAIFTINSALGLTSETLHLSVDLLDQYLQREKVECAQLETLSIACLWIAVKFIETPVTIEDKRIKLVLKRRRHSGNWTWEEILAFEAKILQCLDYRLMAPTILSAVQKKIYECATPLPPNKVQLAYYFADLLLLKDRANAYSKDVVADAIWYVIMGNEIQDVQEPLLAPVVILFLAHRDNINPNHAFFKSWFALRCKYGAFLEAPWQVPYNTNCTCRVCVHVHEEMLATSVENEE